MTASARLLVEYVASVLGSVGWGIHCFKAQSECLASVTSKNIQCNDTARLSGSGLDILCSPNSSDIYVVSFSSYVDVFCTFGGEAAPVLMTPSSGHPTRVSQSDP